MTDLVLFDLDGTITDSQEGIIHSIQYALKKKGIECEADELKSFIGPPLKGSFQEKFPQIDPDEAITDYREYYADKGIFENRVYEGIPELLAKLKDMNIRAAIATSKPEGYARQIIDHFGLSDHIEAVYGATMDSSRVNKEDILDYALAKSHAESPIMVGDRKFDIEGAHAHHLPGVGVTYGFGSRQELEKAGAECIIDQPEELLEWIQAQQ